MWLLTSRLSEPLIKNTKQRVFGENDPSSGRQCLITQLSHTLNFLDFISTHQRCSTCARFPSGAELRAQRVFLGWSVVMLNTMPFWINEWTELAESDAGECFSWHLYSLNTTIVSFDATWNPLHKYIITADPLICLRTIYLLKALHTTDSLTQMFSVINLFSGLY